ncbi:hypothetical protein BT96DRAFT_921549 [Gymnopus androsaceus JB14]|uniref:Aminoglycoside phosphotransferase domain-containing protein n=1 Tax=Gymnopus androsaceus JB14 TaxID=1447944 RepID=A0A6A4HHH8_9AGAR|nr:hypothetical protein BT96DRAFT_921549 [Gymnopus androsaceus JB14]
MEYIQPTSIPVPDLPERAAQALQWLRGLRTPENAKIGSLGGGPARHELFQDYTAPLAFSSLEALERYMNTALKWIPRRCRPDPISISHESLVFTQTDMNVSNFFVDTKGNTCLLDCEDVGLLPASFASYTMCSTLQPFATEVAKYLDWPISSNINSMIRICGVLWMIDDRRPNPWS